MFYVLEGHMLRQIPSHEKKLKIQGSLNKERSKE
uniref:Uncharacterized protein n=1 Tax=Arundo donax TaxID=35708 RepID=A0A0A9AYI6_ARUDO